MIIRLRLRKSHDDEWPGKVHSVRLMPYPQRAKRLGQYTEVRRYRRLRHQLSREYKEMVKKDNVRYDTVQLGQWKHGWVLVYEDGKDGDYTGSFKTKAEAIAWFRNGGR